MTPILADLLQLLELERIEDNIFRGQSRDIRGDEQVFGGQVVGQALVAAGRTVEAQDRLAHSLHAYFLLAGDPKAPIIYEVDRIRDGGSFATRRVIAIQHGRPIFSMGVSFHKAEPGFEHQAVMPDVPPPEALPSEEELLARLLPNMPDEMRFYWEKERPIELRPVDLSRYFCREKLEPKQYLWIKTNGKLPDNYRLHQCALAYASDFSLLDTALIAHGRYVFDKSLQVASLDHSLWFHRPFRADEWLLFVQESPNTSGARGLTRGLLFSHDGRLVASAAQEGLMRPSPS